MTTAISNSSIGVDSPKNVAELSNAIEASEKIGTISSKSQRLLSAAKFMLELRLAYGSSNWRRVGHLLTSISINLLPEIVQPEVFRIRNNLLEHTAREKVISSLKHGGLCGSPTSIDVSIISTDSLDASIRYINAMSNDSENIKYLEKIVVAIRRLRKSTLERDIGAQVNCLSYIDAFVGTTEKEWISNELSLTKILIENEEACEKILSALRKGDGIGEPGALDTSTISTKDLHAALEVSKKLSHATDNTLLIISSGKKVLGLREAFRLERWYDIEDFARDSEAQGGVLSENEREALGLDDAERVETEIMALISEVHIKKAIVLLRNAIIQGRPTFEGAHIDIATVDTTAIDNALQRAELAGVRAGEGQQLVLTAKYIKKLRLSLIEGNWPNVISTLEQIDEIGASPFAAEEISQVRIYAHWYSSVRDVTLGLVNAIATKNVEKLKSLMQRAEVLRLDQNPDVDISSIVIHARTLLVKLQKVDYELEDSLDLSHVHMVSSLDKARRLSYTRSSNAQLVSNRLDRFHSLETRAKQAIEDIDVEEMKLLLQQAERERFSLSFDNELKKFLSLPKSQILQLKLQLYVSRKDVDNISLITMEIKDIYFKGFENSSEIFDVKLFPNLRPGKNDLDIVSRMSFTTEPILKSLTVLDENHNLVSLRIFKYVLGFMGDRKFTHPLTIAVEAIQTAYFHPMLRDELFLQIVKQLNKNPSNTSLKRGYAILYATICTFPPSEVLENYLETFLRTRKLTRIAKRMHVIVYLRARDNPPTLRDIESTINEFLVYLDGSLTVDDGAK